jgi:hypothetical protein
MVWYSDEALEAFAIVVWSLALVLFLVALALPCPLCRRDVKGGSTYCKKCVDSLLGLVFVSLQAASPKSPNRSTSKATRARSRAARRACRGVTTMGTRPSLLTQLKGALERPLEAPVSSMTCCRKPCPYHKMPINHTL